MQVDEPRPALGSRKLAGRRRPSKRVALTNRAGRLSCPLHEATPPVDISGRVIHT